MPTTDPTQTTGTVPVAQNQSPTEEFDLWITQTAAWDPAQQRPSSLDFEPVTPETSGSFDFSLDLPEAYSEPPSGEDSPVQVQTPVQEVMKVPASEVEEAPTETILFAPEQEESSFLPVPENEENAFTAEFSHEEPSTSAQMEDSMPQQNSDALLFAEPAYEETQTFKEDQTSELPQENNFDSTLQSWTVSTATGLQGQNPDDHAEEPLNAEEPLPEGTTVTSRDSSALEASPASGKTLNLDEMISQFSTTNENQSSAQSQMDPFNAMKATLEAHQQKQVVSSSAPVAVQVPLQPTPQLQAPEAPMPVEISTAIESPQSWSLESSPAPTLDLDSLAQMPTNPLTAPTPYPQQALSPSIPAKKGMGKLVGVVFGGVMVVAMGVIAFIRYPDRFNFSSLIAWTPETPSPAIETGTPEHPAPDLIETGTLVEDPNETQTGDITSWESLIQPTEPIEIATDFWEEPESDIKTIILQPNEELHVSTGEEQLPTDSQNQNSDPVTKKDEVSPLDPLGSLEKLVWPINNNDLLKQEISEYQRKGQELKELGSAQNKKTIMKYGLAIEKETTKLLDQLANGENIDISIWSVQKAKLDDYLARATNV